MLIDIILNIHVSLDMKKRHKNFKESLPAALTYSYKTTEIINLRASFIIIALDLKSIMDYTSYTVINRIGHSFMQIGSKLN